MYKGERRNIFQIRAGVPQGSILSPTFYNIYVHDAPETPPRTVKNIFYADDVTQIIATTFGKEHHRDTIVREVERMNNYEKKQWKIRTNLK